MANTYGPVPVGFLKLQAGKNTSFLVGALPTLIGAEYTFSFQNMNILRGLLWNQETAVSRGVQVNQTMGKFTASFSWNDGYYSNRYTWLSGSLAYTNGHHSLALVGGGNYSKTAYQTFRTPVQNNSSIYNVIYTYNNGSLILQPYFQYSNVPTNPAAGIGNGAHTTSGAILANYTFKSGFSIPVRWEYIATSGNADAGNVNLLFGPGSSGTSITVTPTFQKGGSLSAEIFPGCTRWTMSPAWSSARREPIRVSSAPSSRWASSSATTYPKCRLAAGSSVLCVDNPVGYPKVPPAANASGRQVRLPGREALSRSWILPFGS